jgi:type I restriction enzyme S subunit
LAQGATRYNLSKVQFKALEFPFPRFSEQRAIAAALSDIDSLIAALNALIAKKRAIEQAAMQQLLTGKTRLPGFEGKWPKMPTSRLLRVQVGFPFSSAFFNQKGEGIRLVRNRDLKSDDEVLYYSGEYAPEFLVRDGDILVGMDGDFSASMWQKGSALLNQRIARLLVSTSVDKAFTYYSVAEPLKKIERETTGTTVKQLSSSDIANIELQVPSVEEQMAIGKVLSDMDAEIEALEARVAKTRDIKQGMMQQLLTGRVRLPVPTTPEESPP